MTSAQIAAVLMLPIFPKPAEALAPTGRLHDTAGSGLQLAKRWAAKLVLLGTAVFLLIQYGDDMHSVLRHYVYAFGLYAFVGFLMDGPAAVAVEALGLQLVPTFDQPWRSTSLADFWGRRWNITTSSVLRTLVYDPIVQGSLVHPSRLPASQSPATPATALHAGAGVSPKANGHANGHSPADAPASPAAHTNGHATNGHSAEGKVEAAAKGIAAARRRPSAWRRAVGLHAVFLTSGLVHEYVAWCITGSPWGWKWTLFFWVQAPLMQAEALAGKALKALRLPQPPPLLTNIAVVLLLEALAHNLFFGFVESDTNIAQRVVGAVGDNYRAVLAPLMPLLGAAAPGLGAAGSGGGELPVALGDLVPGVVHAGRYLLCRCLVTPYTLRNVASVVGGLDESKQLDLSVYNLDIDEVPGRSADAPHHGLPKGTVLAIKEPYLAQVGGKRDYALIRVDTPMDILIITSPDHPVVAGTPWAELVRKGPSAAAKPATGSTGAGPAASGDPAAAAAALKAEGNALFGAGQYVEALEAYQRGLEALWPLQGEQPGEEQDPGTQQLALDLLNNASAACLGFQAFASAEAYAGLVLARQPDNAKALLRRARALDGMGRYSEAAAACAASIAAAPSAADAPRLEGHADFVGPLSIVDVPGKGRGLVATEAVKAGALLMAVRADAVSYVVEVRSRTPSFVGSAGRINSPTQPQLDRDYAFLLLGCGRLAHRLAYLHESETGADTPPLPRRSECGYGVEEDAEQAGGGEGEAAEGGGGGGGEPDGERVAAAEAFERATAITRPSPWLLSRGLLRATDEGYFSVDEQVMSIITSTNVFGPDPLPSMEPMGMGDEHWDSASGVWSLPSYINHSCVGNVARYFLGDFMFIRAARDVAEGEELTFGYTDSLTPLAERQRSLSKHGFTCACELCTEQVTWKERRPEQARELDGLVRHFEETMSQEVLHVARALDWGGPSPALQLAGRLQALTTELDAAFEGRAWRPEGMRPHSAWASCCRPAGWDHAGAATAYERSLNTLRCGASGGGNVGSGGGGGSQAGAGSPPAALLCATKTDPLQFAEQYFLSPVSIMSMLNAATNWAQVGGRPGKQRAEAWTEAARLVWVRLYGIYNLAMDKVPGNSADVSAHCLPMGTVLAVKEPYVRPMEGVPTIRVNSPMDVLPITSPDHPLVAGTPWAELVRKGPSAAAKPAAGSTGAGPAASGDPAAASAALKAEGNALFGAGQYGEQPGEEQDPGTQQLALDLLNNASAACLGFQAFPSAEAYAGLVLARQPGNAKALLRRARALDGMGRFSEAATACKAATQSSTQAPAADARVLLSEVRRRAAEAERGQYDEMYRVAAASTASNTPSFEGHADYVGPVSIVDVPGKGRGLVATKAVKAGTLLMAVRADAITYTDLPYDPSVMDSDAATTHLVRDLPMLLLGFGRLAQRIAYLQSSGTGGRAPPLPRRSECGYGVGAEEEEGGAAGPPASGGSEGGGLGRERAAAAAAYERATAPVRPSRWLLQRGLIAEPTQGFIAVSELVMRGMVDNNAFTCDQLPGGSGMQRTPAASGVWSLPSYINYDCIGNVCRYFLGDFMFVRAARDMAEGEELNWSYTSPLKSLEERRQELSTKHGFTCGCELCSEQAAWAALQPEKARRIAELLAKAQSVSSSASGPAVVAQIKRLAAEVDAALEGRVWRIEAYHLSNFLAPTVGVLNHDMAGAAAASEKALSALAPWGQASGSKGLAEADPLAYAEQRLAVAPSAIKIAMEVACTWGMQRNRVRSERWEKAAQRMWERSYGSGSGAIFEDCFKTELQVLQMIRLRF
ncbi:hypothetical protein HYH03_005568 [Edaphochlamys debaryana]|uniref:SET domain-containing protein n=1 Tax=Edaphochlamys debaryana TaxID=47281 RepID=A0A835Y5F9_9CHLO|nr:hypothetical protein HYH03_005568 [Edaphochlamys debaryana]|eukprot:KAG2496338.1 hypothetical protein HYH03_005568 [Edaphochlamys debaryana]